MELDLTVEELTELISVNMIGLDSELYELTPSEALERVAKIKTYANLLEEKIKQAAKDWEEML